MAGKISNRGERKLIAAAIAGTSPYTIHLAKASFDDDDEDLIPGDFTEADYDGYASQTLVFSSLEPGNPGGKAIADFAESVFTCSSPSIPNLIYGYWVEDVDGDVIFWELFKGSPRPMRNAGQQVKVTFSLRLWSPL